MRPTIRCRPAGDSAVTVTLGAAITPQLNRAVRAMAQQAQGLPGVLCASPAYCALTVEYDPLTVPYRAMVRALKQLAHRLDEAALPPPRRFVLPVLYGGKWGPDLDFVANNAGLAPDEVVALHSGRDYQVYMLGFLPGFPYLGGMDERLAAPRLGTPRARIPGGSVGIAGAQTGVYPLESPGGWRLLGRTPVRLYSPQRTPPVPCRPGDYLRFEAIGDDDYHALDEKAKNEGWFPPVQPMEVAP